MIEHTYQVLGYYRLLDIISKFTSCSLGQSNCLSLRPSNDLKFIDNELKLVSEMRLLLKMEGFLPFSELTDILSLLSISRTEGAYLAPDELIFILGIVDAGQKSKKFFMSQRQLYPGLYLLIKDLPDFETLIKRVKKAISPNGTIKDSASPALKKIREKKVRLRSDLQKRLEDIQGTLGLNTDKQRHPVTIRDGRYIIPLSASRKSRIEGIVHDYSKTRATCFFEPLEVIRDNNRIAELSCEEREEEHRILSGLTAMVRDMSDDIEHTQILIARLDGLYARAGFCEALSCVMPEIVEHGDIHLKGAKNPILLATAVEKAGGGGAIDYPVPVDILMDGQHNILLISGPNRGGKTVTIKTLGLTSLMAQSGIHIPAEEGSRLPLFDHVMANIGDDQDDQAGLSTFSAHAAHLKYLTEHADQKSLIIIDEPGMGTDPDEGAAIAIAVLEFVSKQGSYVAVSTHLNRLKNYGLMNRRAVNASVEFDVENNRPSFKLRYGTPGTSHAFKIAKDVGISSDILAHAREFLDPDEVLLNRLIDKLNRATAKADREKKEANDIKKEFFEAAKEYQDKLNKLESEKKVFLETMSVETKEVINRAKDEFRELINLLKKRKEPAQAYVANRFSDISNALTKHLVPEKESFSEPIEPKIGRRVYHKKLNQEGIIHSVDRSGKRVQLMLGNIKLTADVYDLVSVNVSANKAKRLAVNNKLMPVSRGFEGTSTKELRLIGYRVNDAVKLIDKTIDRALVDGNLTLRIIHGYGTGQLRTAIRTHLGKIACVKKFYSAAQDAGGDAVTVVEI
ncbi:MAG: hypothetical protein B1H11_03820 [Desulfobacteraceae bacterium 4484_190.1]|nr:MAG: hypothetical protein B1H11_03820 [Desulfobacteraceae bacterium 4484_190.1]